MIYLAELRSPMPSCPSRPHIPLRYLAPRAALRLAPRPDPRWCEYAAHDRLPSEAELGELSGVSRITVRRALATLENEGRIYRRQGLGSFVAPPAAAAGTRPADRLCTGHGAGGLSASSRVLHQAPEAAPPFVAEALGVEPGAPTVRLDRLRLGDDRPVALDRTWLPPFYAQFLDGHDLTTETIYRVLERDYEIPIAPGPVPHRGDRRARRRGGTTRRARGGAAPAGRPDELHRG